jgi:hypothetical protein
MDKEIIVSIRITDKGFLTDVRHRGYGEKVTTEQILETIGALENVKQNWLAKLPVRLSINNRK